MLHYSLHACAALVACMHAEPAAWPLHACAARLHACIAGAHSTESTATSSSPASSLRPQLALTNMHFSATSMLRRLRMPVYRCIGVSNAGDHPLHPHHQTVSESPCCCLRAALGCDGAGRAGICCTSSDGPEWCQMGWRETAWPSSACIAAHSTVHRPYQQ